MRKASISLNLNEQQKQQKVYHFSKKHLNNELRYQFIQINSKITSEDTKVSETMAINLKFHIQITTGKENFYECGNFAFRE